MAGEIPAQPGLNQTRVEQLAVQYTQPRRGTRYRDPPAVRRAFRTARQRDTEEAWKAAQQGRRKARDEWRQAKVVRAGQGGCQGSVGEAGDRVGSAPDRGSLLAR